MELSLPDLKDGVSRSKAFDKFHVSELTLKEAFKKYKISFSILKKGYHQERYRIEQISRSFLGEMFVKDITSVHIATYRDQRLSFENPITRRRLSSATVRLELTLLSTFFNIARIEWGICGENPVVNVRKPKVSSGRDRRLTTKEDRLILRHAFNYANPELYSIIIIALESAMRQGEILSLQWQHINFRTCVVHLPDTKNGTKRDVPLSHKAIDAIKRLEPKTQGNVFKYTSNGFKSSWRSMIKKLKIENLHFHDLRHEAVSRLFELSTLDMMEIAAISGHKSLSMLKRYTHLKAHSLVKKLEGKKQPGKQAIFDILVPYPAIVFKDKHRVAVKLLDFDELIIYGRSQPKAIKSARQILLQKLLHMVRHSEEVPRPDQYLKTVDAYTIIWVDPLFSAQCFN